jgi:hypothetical protein
LIEYDVRKALKELYNPKKEPSLVYAPQQVYCIVDGEGKAEDEAYELAVQMLYAISTTLQAEFGRHRLNQSFAVSPLDCLCCLGKQRTEDLAVVGNDRPT